MTTHIFDVVAFRQQFIEFADITQYPDVVLSGYFDMATCTINDSDTPVLHGKCLQLSLNLMTAHITKTMTNAAAGMSQVGVQTGASIDKVSVTYSAPPFKSGWQAWLSQTPYGLQLWAMLQAMASGGFYVGGRPEAESFRTEGGYWG